MLVLVRALVPHGASLFFSRSPPRAFAGRWEGEQSSFYFNPSSRAVILAAKDEPVLGGQGQFKVKFIAVLEQGLHMSLLRVWRMPGHASSAFCSLLWSQLLEGGARVAV